MKKTILLFVCAAIAIAAVAEERVFKPAGTFMFAERDTCSLWLDIYNPTPGSVTSVGGQEKPTVLFVFGGGFVGGERDNGYQREWYKRLCDEGYHVVAIDYRLGLKGVSWSFNMKFLHAVQNAIDIAVDDLFAATSWLIDHGMEHGIDVNNLVVSGSSAGAITVLQAEYEIANRTKRCPFPTTFNYAGVMSFSGALYSYQGGPYYKTEPCPTLLFHGTEDKIVTYKKMKLGRLFFGGLEPLAKMYKKKGFNYNAYRFTGHDHEIASAMMRLIHEELHFLESNVMRGKRRIVDTFVDDPDIPVPEWAGIDYKAIYK